MRSRTAALVTATMLCASLYGCSSSVQRSGAISGAATSAASNGAAAVGAVPSASLAPVPGLSMTFAIPADLTLEFQTADQGSATANQIETILVYQYKAFIEALSSSEAKEANYRSLTVGDALGAENTELGWWKQQDERLKGVDRLYAFAVKVSATGDHTAVYSFCEDSTALEYLNLSSDQTVENTAGPNGNYTLRQGVLVKGKGELWAVQTLITQDGAASCIGK